MNNDFTISVIVSTYNRPDALKAVLTSLLSQEDDNYEIVIADDGSSVATKSLIEDFSRRFPNFLRHVWQPNRGFRAAKIRNKAIQRAQGDYLLILDGDCIPTQDWISENRKLAEQGWVVQGQRILLSELFTKELLQSRDLTSFRPTLREAQCLCKEKKINRWSPLLRIPLGSVRKIAYKKWKRIRSCNLGVWRKDILRIHGFDESFIGWGHEDADLAVRLINAGTRIKLGTFSSTVFHLWHSPASRISASKNWATVLQRVSSGEIFPMQGIQ